MPITEVALTPYGTETPVPTSTATPAGSSGVRYVNPALRDYVIDTDTGQQAQMPTKRQRVLLSVMTMQGSVSVDLLRGIKVPKKMTSTFNVEMDQSVRAALAYMTDVEKSIVIDGIDIVTGTGGRAQVTIRFTDTETGEQDEAVIGSGSTSSASPGAADTGRVPVSGGALYTFASGAFATGIASGDLSGNYPSPTVAKINGATAPSSPGAGDVGKAITVSGAGVYTLGSVAPVAPDLSAYDLYWPLSGNSLPYANEGSAGTLDLAKYSNANCTYRPGLYGEFTFATYGPPSGSGCYLCTGATSKGQADDLTVLLWVYFTYGIGPGQHILGKCRDNGGNYAWRIYTTSTPSVPLGALAIEVTHNSGGTKTTLELGSSYLDNLKESQWQLIGFTFKSSTKVLTFYSHSMPVWAYTCSLGTIYYGSELDYDLMGMRYSSYTTARALIQNILVTTSVLSASEVAAIERASRGY